MPLCLGDRKWRAEDDKEDKESSGWLRRAAGRSEMTVLVRLSLLMFGGAEESWRRSDLA
jgi:hypothetical protein